MLIFVMLCANIYDRTKSTSFLIFCFVMMSVLAGFRDVNVGTDSWNYYFQFENKDILNDINFPTLLTNEGLFDVLVWLSQKLSNNYFALFTLVAMLVYGASLKAIKDNSSSVTTSLFVYISLGIAVFCYNGERQAIAIAIYMLSFHSLQTKQFWKYCAIVLFATLFHRTIIVAIPLYFIFTAKFH